LGLISKLSPARKFYPVHLKTMQTATFIDEVSVITQRDIFFGTASEIVAHNMKASCLFQAEVSGLVHEGDFGLLDRSHHRTRKLFPSESVASAAHSADDYEYCSRNQESDTNLHASAKMAGLVQSGAAAFSVATHLKDLLFGWKRVSGFDKSTNFDSFSSLLGGELKEMIPSLMNFAGQTNLRSNHVYAIAHCVWPTQPCKIPSKLCDRIQKTCSPVDGIPDGNLSEQQAGLEGGPLRYRLPSVLCSIKQCRRCGTLAWSR
jgi:hypothetical protein